VWALYRRIAPWMLTAFAVMFASGIWLFIGYATNAYENTFFRLKLLAMIGAGGNAFFFHRISSQPRTGWNDAGQTPPGARVAGAVSMAAWAIVIVCGRMMSYTMF
jgi:hypothetical protein